MSTRQGVSRSFSAYSHRVDDNYDGVVGIDDSHDDNSSSSNHSAARSLSMRRCISGPPRNQRMTTVGESSSSSPASSAGAGASPVALQNMERLMSDGSACENRRRPTAVDRRRESLRSKRYAGCDRIPRRERNSSMMMDDESARSCRRSSRGSLTGAPVSDEDWAMFKEALNHFA